MLTVVVVFIILFSGSVEYPMPYVSCLASCNVVSWCLLGNVAQLSLGTSCLMQLSLSPNLGLCSPFLFRVFCIVLWDSLSGLCALWDSLSSFLSLWLGRCTLGWPVWPVVGYPLLGVHPSITIVRQIMIGYHCNCLDGQLNCWASTHWLISVTIMYWIHDQWLCHSTLLQRLWDG